MLRPHTHAHTRDGVLLLLLLRFTTVDAAGKKHELFPGGKHMAVGWHSRKQWVRAVREFKVGEFQWQAAAIAR